MNILYVMVGLTAMYLGTQYMLNTKHLLEKYLKNQPIMETKRVYMTTEDMYEKEFNFFRGTILVCLGAVVMFMGIFN